jgi:hypothetical protein
MSINLSKSKYLSGLQCVKKLWLEVHDREKASPPSKADERILNQGTEVGIEARKRFFGGVLIDYDHSDPMEMVKKTKRLITQGVKTVFEGAFFYDEILVLVDVLTKNDDESWDLTEVKSSVQMKDTYISDLAVQKYVVEGSGINIKKTNLMHLNKECIFPDLDELFLIIDATDLVNERVGSLSENLTVFKSIISQQEEPDILIGPHCNDPYECPFISYCWEYTEDKSVFIIPNLDKNKKVLLHLGNIIAIDKLPSEFPLTDKQWEYVHRILNKDIKIDAVGIEDKLSKLEYPIHFLDFETFNPAIPRFEGMSPFNHFPFQYSCHILKNTGELDHYEYIHTDTTDPRRPLAISLMDCLGEAGSVVAYYAGFERRVLEKLSECYPEFKPRIESVIERLWDQLDIFKYYYKHYAFGNSNSLKSVLPVIVPELTYEELEIKDGADAQAVWDEMINIANKSDKDKMIKELRAYCRMDTLAMVEIHRKLQTV